MSSARHTLIARLGAAALAVFAIVSTHQVVAADKVRIGVVLPKAQLGQGTTGADVAEPVRQTLIAYLSGPATEIVPITARIPIQIDAEATQAGVQYVLYTSVVHKKGRGGGGGFGKLLGAMAPVAGMIPGAGALGSTGAIVASQAATAAAMAAQQQAQEQAMAQLMSASQSNIKKGDQIAFEYKLTKSGTAVATKLTNGKATQDGQDLLSPLIEQVATEVLTSVSST